MNKNTPVASLVALRLGLSLLGLLFVGIVLADLLLGGTLFFLLPLLSQISLPVILLASIHHLRDLTRTQAETSTLQVA